MGKGDNRRPSVQVKNYSKYLGSLPFKCPLLKQIKGKKVEDNNKAQIKLH